MLSINKLTTGVWPKYLDAPQKESIHCWEIIFPETFIVKLHFSPEYSLSNKKN